MSEDAHFILKKYMSRLRFKLILQSICYINREDLEYNYWFFYMIQMEEAWNINIANEFNRSLIDVLERNIIEWFNKYTPRCM